MPQIRYTTQIEHIINILSRINEILILPCLAIDSQSHHSTTTTKLLEIAFVGQQKTIILNFGIEHSCMKRFRMTTVAQFHIARSS